MEHIVQFAIGIDDAAIQKRIEENAYTDILEQIKNDALKSAQLPKSYSSRNSSVDNIDGSQYIDWRIRDAIKEWKPDIIQATAKILANSVKRTKDYKETIPPMVEAFED